MQNVASIHSAVNGVANVSYEEVINWHLQKSERGEVPHITARLRNTAISQLVTVLGPEEPRDPQSLHDNIAEIGRRWAIKNSANSATAQSYIARARSGLGDWLAWRQEPTKFKFKGQTPAEKARDKARDRSKNRDQEPTPTPPPVSAIAPIAQAVAVSAPKHEEAPPAQPPSPPAEHARKAQPGDLRECRLGGGRTFQYLLPSDGLQLKDVMRLIYHLATICDDYDPMVSPVQVFANMQRGGQ